MRTEGWRGKGKSDLAQWRIEARKAKAIASRPGYSTGGLPRHKTVAAVTLPKLRCQEEQK